MKTSISAFGRMTKSGGHDTRDRCGKLTLTAQNEVDAMLLALLGRVFIGVGLKCQKDARYRLYQHLLTEADKFNENFATGKAT